MVYILIVAGLLTAAIWVLRAAEVDDTPASPLEPAPIPETDRWLAWRFLTGWPGWGAVFAEREASVLTVPHRWATHSEPIAEDDET